MSVEQHYLRRCVEDLRRDGSVVAQLSRITMGMQPTRFSHGAPPSISSKFRPAHGAAAD